MALNQLLAGHEDITTASLIPEYIQNAPEKVRQRICALKKLHMQSVDVQADFYRRVHQLETEFRERYDKLNNQRAKIVNGEYEPAANEADEQIFSWMDEDQLVKFNEAKPTSGGDNEGPKGIPDFWFNALRNTPGVGELITERDEQVLHYLKDITVDQTNDPPAFTLNFHFAENPYFTNSVLTKHYTLSIGPNEFETKAMYDGPSIVATKGCNIDWKPDMNITEKVIKKKGKKGGNAGRTVTKVVPNDSFFAFFKPEYEQISKDMPDEVVETLNADFEAGQMIRDSLVDSAVLFYTEEAVDDDEFDYGGESDEEDGGSDEDQ